MKPPKYAKSVTVQAPENGVTLVQLTAIYKGNESDDETVTVTLTKDGESHTWYGIVDSCKTHSCY